MQTEREARGLVETLLGKPLSRADVVAYLGETRAISDAVRQKALTLAEGAADPQDPEAFDRAAWAVARQRYLYGFIYRFALSQARAACRLDPGEGRYRTTLGAAQYRAGRYADALETLRKAGEESPRNLAFRAMALHKLGQGGQARDTLARLREVLKGPGRAGDDGAEAILSEAETQLR